MASKAAKAIHYAKLWKRRRVWYISPEGFRELRHSCLLSRQRAADYLGVSLRTIRHWDAGRNRVPWSVVRLLRLMRAGELGGLLDGWEGWTIWRDRLVSPDGRAYIERDMRHLWLTLTQAALFRESYDRATAGGVGAPAPADACAAVPLTWRPDGAADALPTAAVIEAAAPPRPPAFDRYPAPEKAPEAPDAGKAAGAAGGRSGAPLVRGASMAAAGGLGANMTPQWHHETANGGGNAGACNMEQTAPVCHLTAPDSPCRFLPLANRGGTNLNEARSGVTLTSPCKGVA